MFAIPKPLTMGDADALRDQFAAPSIAAVAPALQGDATVSFGGEQTSPQLFGVTPEYFQVRNLNVTEGELITEEHMLGRASVVLLGPEVAETSVWSCGWGHRRNGSHRGAAIPCDRCVGIKRWRCIWQ